MHVQLRANALEKYMVAVDSLTDISGTVHQGLARGVCGWTACMCVCACVRACLYDCLYACLACHIHTNNKGHATHIYDAIFIYALNKHIRTSNLPDNTSIKSTYNNAHIYIYIYIYIYVCSNEIKHSTSEIAKESYNMYAQL